MPKIPDEQKPAVSKVIAPTALFWFRWGAMATLVTGLILACMNGYLVQALSLQTPYTAIGIGMWLGLIMWFNVWFIIWPNQKKALGIVTVDAGGEGQGGEDGRHDLALQHHAVDADALLHGGAAERRPVGDGGNLRLWQAWWLGGAALAALTAGLVWATERAYGGGQVVLGDLASVTRILLYLVWLHAVWRCSRNVERAAMDLSSRALAAASRPGG